MIKNNKFKLLLRSKKSMNNKKHLYKYKNKNQTSTSSTNYDTDNNTNEDQSENNNDNTDSQNEDHQEAIGTNKNIVNEQNKINTDMNNLKNTMNKHMQRWQDLNDKFDILKNLLNDYRQKNKKINGAINVSFLTPNNGFICEISSNYIIIKNNIFLWASANFNNIYLKKPEINISLSGLPFQINKNNCCGTINIFNNDVRHIYCGLAANICQNQNNNIIFKLSNRPVIPLEVSFPGTIQINIVCEINRNQT